VTLDFGDESVLVLGVSEENKDDDHDDPADKAV